MKITNWKMKYENYGILDCTSPCSMYSVLLENKLIDDPFYGINEKEATKLSEKDCCFYTEFNLTNEDMKKDYIELTFYGLDTICDIFLNEELLASVMNMHRTYTYEIKDMVFAGKNKLRLEFKSPIKYFKKMDERHYLWTNGDSIPGAAHLRKGLSMSGWDWGPQLPDMGITRDIELRAYNTDKIEDVMILQDHEHGKVELSFKASSTHSNPENKIFAEVDGKKVELKKNQGKITIYNPKLWWPRGYGEQNLYTVIFTLENNGKVLDTVTKRIGIRTLTVSCGPQNGHEFCFVVNGVKIFAMGANYIPQDNLLSRITEERTRKFLSACCDANFNCIRVWGGGYYPEDFFFDICDEFGLIVWQDFMSACINIWLRKDFEKEFKEEAICNLKRIRHHASLGLMCGNNEMEDGVKNWKVGNIGIGDSQLIRDDYIRLYERILPDICEDYAPETFYWPSSPSSGGGFDDPQDFERGDVHYWAVWHGGIPFTDYRNHKFRFCSEYGFESFPSVKTIKSFCPEEEMNIFSRVMENHQKNSAGNGKILSYLADNYLYPSKFDNLVYASQILQAEAIKYGVEHFRRNRGYCMGSIYWQVNDCWPVASWSSIDYYGRYKALHYAAKKFYAPVEMGLFYENGEITVNISNEQMKAFNGFVKMYICKNDFSVLASETVSVNLKKLSSKDVGSLEKLEEYDDYSCYFYADLFDENGDFIVRGTQLFVPAKHFEWEKPEYSIKCSDCDSGVEITISANTFTKFIELDFDELDIIFSDNYFDITSTDSVKVLAKTALPAETIKEKLKIKSVYNIGE